ncbi:MAG TPA: hypothetical protein ENG66_01095 [Thermococcus sp.]|nr:hypothetical protein [Thermococcus sp.]
MKAEQLTKQHFDKAFKAVLAEKKDRHIIIISTYDLAKKLWELFRVPIRKEIDLIREKMREWWRNYPWLENPRPHKKICGVAVELGSPMAYDYCCLEKSKGGLICRSLIVVCQNQQDYFQNLRGD